MKVHVLAYKNCCGYVVRAVFTDANLDLAEDYAEQLCSGVEADDPVVETFEVDDPEEIAALKEEMTEYEKELAEFIAAEYGDDESTPEVAKGSCQTDKERRYDTSESKQESQAATHY